MKLEKDNYGLAIIKRGIHAGKLVYFDGCEGSEACCHTEFFIDSEGVGHSLITGIIYIPFSDLAPVSENHVYTLTAIKSQKVEKNFQKAHARNMG